MSKYEPLAKFLSAHRGSVWEATFDDVEKVLGDELPGSARKHRPWWANQSGGGHSQTLGWQSVGWETRDVDLERERVKFVRRDAKSDPEAAHVPTPKPQDGPRDTLLAKARQISGMQDDDFIINTALEAFIQREAARHLAEMGGTMPDIKAPPRRRFMW